MVRREDAVWDALEQVEDKYGLEHEFDQVHVQDLPDETPAMTQQNIHGPGEGDTHLVVDQYLDRYGDQNLETVLVHELLHSNQFNGNFGEKFQRQYGVSDELSERLNEVVRNGDRSEIEGMTQALTNKIVENGEVAGRYFYPYETQAFEKELEQEGIDLDEEFDQDVYSSVLDQQDMYGLEGRMEIGDNFLYHQMNVGGEDYELLVFGEEAEEYIEALDDEYGLDDLANTYGSLEEDGEGSFYFESYGDLEYGKSPNSIGNVTADHEVPDASSMSTGTNGLPERESTFG